MQKLTRLSLSLVAALTALAASAAAWAQTAAAPAAAAAAPAAAAPVAINSGDTAWMLTSTALVLMMTIPGLALFYGGMVRKKNVLATVMQSFAITCLVTVLWMVVGYSLAFTEGNPIIGGLSRLFLRQHDSRQRQRPREDHSRIGLYVLPDDLRDHHPGADLRRLRRSHEVLGDAVVHGGLERPRLFADRPLGLGPGRLSQRCGRARLRRRHRRAHQCRRRRADLRPRPRQAQGLRRRDVRAAQPRAQRHRRLAAVGRLVRLQRRLGDDGERQRRHGDGGDPDRDGDGRA